MCLHSFQLTYFEPLLADKAIHPGRHVTADVTYGEMKTEYDRLMREDPAFAQAMAARAGKKSDDDDKTMSMLSAVSKANSDQKRLVGILCRGFLKDLQALDPAMRVQSLRWVRPMSLPNEPQAPTGYPVAR